METKLATSVACAKKQRAALVQHVCLPLVFVWFVMMLKVMVNMSITPCHRQTETVEKDSPLSLCNLEISVSVLQLNFKKPIALS